MPFQSLQHYLEGGAKLYVCSINPTNLGAIALLYPPIVIDDSSWKNVAESFTIALTLNLDGGGGTKVQ